MNQELEKLIDLTLVDGHLSDKERVVIYNKAKQLGIDELEVDVILEGKLQQIQAKQPKSVKEKVGSIKTCPACGEQLSSFLSNCPACGHEIAGKAANSSILALQSKIELITSKHNERKLGVNSTESFRIDMETNKEISSLVSSIAIPTTTEDLIEMTAFCFGNLNNVGTGTAFKGKFKECISKMKILGVSNPNLLGIANEYESQVSQEEKKNWRLIAIVWGVIILIGIVVLLIIK
jgi:hypothetical protein